MDWSAVGGLVAQAAPTIGGLLGGLIPFPGGSMLGTVAGKILAEALGVPPTPEAVGNAIQTTDPAVLQTKLSEAEARMNAEVEKFKAELEDVQDARATNLKLVEAGSSLGYAPAIVSIVVLIGFMILSFIAMKPELAGVRTDVTLFLLGAWSGYTSAVVTYWLGSSAGSSEKSNQLAVLAGAATTAPKKPAVKK